MANEISNDVTIISVDNMIYQAISEIWHNFSKHSSEYRILNFKKGFLDSNEIDETTFCQRLKTFKKVGKIIDKPSKNIHVTIHDDPSDSRKGSVHVEEVVHNEPRDSLIVLDQVSNKSIYNSTITFALL